jgi:hypothetical protein
MIDPLLEDLILPIEATSLFPRNRRGKRIHVSAVYRFMKAGHRGVILESLKCPRLVSSRQAVARFLERLSHHDNPSGSMSRCATARDQISRNVEKELDHLGI